MFIFARIFTGISQSSIKQSQMRTAIIGGGAAGFFLAINLKEMVPEMEVTLFERGRRVLSKVEVSGGGRCNCTNSFEGVTDLSQVYPRGHRLLKRLFHVFNQQDAYQWFERHGVRLVTQSDQCVFPASQDSHTIIDCFMREARRLGVTIRLEYPVNSLTALSGYDFVAVTTGGSPKLSGLQWLADLGHHIEEPVPSLFTFGIQDPSLQSLMGTVVDPVTVQIPGTKFLADGALLITHWGMSGPAILKLSSYAARYLQTASYHATLHVNWVHATDAEVVRVLCASLSDYPQRYLSNINPFGLPQRLWSYLLTKSVGERTDVRCAELSKKEQNRLVNTLCNDSYQITSRAAFKEEFVTCGGVSLKSVHPNTLESKVVPRLFFAGEVLDIDGVTGGFNFQAAWTTAFTVARAIACFMTKDI